MFPPKITMDDNFQKYYEKDRRYAKIHLKDLKFTGHSSKTLGKNTGYYYYFTSNGICQIVLLSPESSQQGLPIIEELTVPVRIEKGNRTYKTLLEQLAKDLNWTSEGISSKVPNYYLSEPAFRLIPSGILISFLLFSMAIAILDIILCILYIRFPVLSPPCKQLSLYGKPKRLLALAEEELATLPQLATEDMFITEHFFIEITPTDVAIVPINQIQWIYKYSTLHKVFWYHFSISYTMNIVANKHLYIRCPKNTKSDIDGIMDYLAEANHNILVGFNEENRKKVLQASGPVLPIQRFLSFMKIRL